MQKTIKEIIELSTAYLLKAGIESPRVDVEWIVATALKLKRMDLYLQFDRPLEESELVHIRCCLSRRNKHEPLQYILGDCEFYGIDFKVGPGVLVPRPETELLVDHVLKGLNPEDSVLDLCTGSGCIAISLKVNKPEIEVVGTDISPEALKYAKINREHNSCEVDFRQGDLFSAFVGERFNVICTNPPYVGELERSQMGQDVLKYEPHLALFSDNDGLTILKKIAQEALTYLKPGGYIISEMGPTQGESLKGIFEHNGWSNVEIIQDYSSRDRFLKAYKL